MVHVPLCRGAAIWGHAIDSAFISDWPILHPATLLGLLAQSKPWLAEISEVRVVSWNVAFGGPKTAKRQGALLRELAPDLMLL
jgi:hypothetical protein